MKAQRKILGVLIAAVALFLVPVGSAHAAPFTMSIDNAILDLGGLKGVRAIDSTIDPPDPAATLAGDLTGSTVNVPKDDFEFPMKTAEVTAGIFAQIDMFANEDITGTYDSGSGLLVLDASLKATVSVLGSNCVISPIVLQLRSDNANPYLGQAFSSGIEGNGIIGASWTTLPPVTGGGSCGVVAGLITGPGGIAMSHGISEFKTCVDDPDNLFCSNIPDKPVAKPKILNGPPVSTKSDVATFTFQKGDAETQPVTGFVCKLDDKPYSECNSGSKTYTSLTEGKHTFYVKATNVSGEGDETADQSWTVVKEVKPPPGPAALGPLSVKPSGKKVKRGKSIVITAKVNNTGDSAAEGVKVCIKAPKKLVKVKKACVTKGALAAGATATVKFKATVARKARKKAKATLTFKATGTGLAAKTAKAVIRVG